MNRYLYIIFALLTSVLLVTLGFILWKEMNPEWKRYQKAFFQEERQKAAMALKDADEAERPGLQNRLRRLRRPRYRIRQILLKNGRRADRCITCHLDLKELGKKHPEIERFPFEGYGCTVCHGGVGRATETSRAHSTLRIPSRPLYEYLEARNAETSSLDLFRYNASGERIPYTGSNRCLRCHLSSHPRHVARWRRLKFKPLDAVRDKLKALQQTGFGLDETRCLGCHTTAFNERTGHYLEDRVTCENCHGPGGFYAGLMAGGSARDGAELARTNILETRSDRVCINCHKPGRHRDYEGADRPARLIAAYLDGKPAPEINGGGVLDNAWNIAPETRVSTWQLNDGPPRPGTDVFIRALYNDTHIYFVFRWRDKTRNDRMGRWLYTGGRWQAEAEWPDALALHWQATAQVEDFGQGGCAVLCHNSGRFREFPRMATRQEGALVDEWYWNAFTAEKAGRPGDGFLDHRTRFIPSGSSTPALRYTPPEISAAHGSDDSGARMPETVGGIPLTLNAKETEDGQPTPIFYVEQGRRMPLQSTGGAPREKWLPLYETGAPEGGDSEDIRGGSFWSDGYWTLEFKRSLRTSSKRDVQLQPSEKSYSFGLAVWDGAAGQKHQVATVVRLGFESIAEAR